jgi:hypothetical protein
MRRTRELCGPTVAAFGDLDEPGRVPARDDRLAVGMTSMMMIGAARRRGFRIAARPHAGIAGIPGGRCLQGLCCHQVLQPGQRHGSGIEGIVDAAPGALSSQERGSNGPDAR